MIRAACLVWLAVCWFALASAPARAEQLIVALSTEEVRITSNFTGTSITVFGAIERDAATVSRAEFYDVVVALKGPPETVVTRRKERFLGIWLNSASRTFVNIPSFYAINSSRPLSEVSTPQILKRFQIGSENMVFPVSADEGAETADADNAFRQAFIRLKQQDGLFRSEAYGVTFPGNEIFQTALRIPANVPVGRYGVTVYLFRDGALLATDQSEIRIAKTGFEQFTFDLAHNQGLIYGLICVILAVFTGWLAGIIFRRD
jgi:uncharacterized protein (TIGR02186 family)